LAAVTGHLMQPPEMVDAFWRCIPKAPAAKAGQKQGTGAISSLKYYCQLRRCCGSIAPSQL